MQASHKVSEKVQKIIAEALYVDETEVKADASLMGDLGAESIDFLDILFRLEKEFAVKIPKGEIEKNARGNLSDDEFSINGVIQPRGLEQLKVSLPEADLHEIREGLRLRDIPSLLKVATFEKMVVKAIADHAHGDMASADGTAHHSSL